MHQCLRGADCFLPASNASLPSPLQHDFQLSRQSPVWADEMAQIVGRLDETDLTVVSPREAL